MSLSKSLTIMVLAMQVLLGIPYAHGQDYENQTDRSTMAGDLCNQALSLAASHKPDKAIELYRKACTLDPNSNSACVHANFGILLGNLGKLDDSIVECKKALQLDPNAIQAKRSLASSLCAKAVQLTHASRYSDAKVLYDQASTIKGLPPADAAEICVGYALVLERMNRINDAIAQYKTALTYDPHNKDAIYDAACCYEHAGDIEQAKKYFTQYLTEFPNDANRGLVQATLNSFSRKKSFVDANINSSDYLKNVIAEGIEVWPAKAMPLRIFIPKDSDLPGFRKSFTDILTNSFNEWARAANKYFSWKAAPNELEANVVCKWSNNSKDLKYQGMEQGQTSRSYINGGRGRNMITHAQIMLCFVDPASGQVVSDKVMTELCLHEIGHALGLKGHSANRDDVMFYASGEIYPLHQLSSRDIATINRLYDAYGIVNKKRALINTPTKFTK